MPSENLLFSSLACTHKVTAGHYYTCRCCTTHRLCHQSTLVELPPRTNPRATASSSPWTSASRDPTASTFTLEARYSQVFLITMRLQLYSKKVLHIIQLNLLIDLWSSISLPNKSLKKTVTSDLCRAETRDLGHLCHSNTREYTL